MGFGTVYRDWKTASTVPRAAFRRRNHPFCVRWCLRSSLTYRDLEEIMAERNLSVDHVTIWRWVQRYAPVLNQRVRREMRHPNRSWRVDETYVRVARNWAPLSRCRFCWRDDRVHIVAEARPDRGDVVPVARIIGRRASAACDQRRRPSGVRPRDHRVEAVRRTRPTLLLPNGALSERHHATQTD